jgi:hypothetical protein
LVCWSTRLRTQSPTRRAFCHERCSSLLVGRSVFALILCIANHVDLIVKTSIFYPNIKETSKITSKNQQAWHKHQHEQTKSSQSFPTRTIYYVYIYISKSSVAMQHLASNSASRIFHVGAHIRIWEASSPLKEFHMKCFASHSRTVVRGDIHLMLCCRAHLPVTCVPVVLELWAWLAVALCSVKTKTKLVFCTIPPGIFALFPGMDNMYIYIYIYIQFSCYGRGLRWLCVREAKNQTSFSSYHSQIRFSWSQE